MIIQTASITIATHQLSETRHFYERYFDAKATFDCGWYVVLRLGQAPSGPEICLMEPRHGTPAFAGGIMFNLRVTDVDACHAQFIESGVQPVKPLADHPWGDRGFGVLDPADVLVYCYCEIEPAPEYQAYFVR